MINCHNACQSSSFSPDIGSICLKYVNATMHNKITLHVQDSLASHILLILCPIFHFDEIYMYVAMH